MILIKKGIDLPISVPPNQMISETNKKETKSIAVVPPDYQGLKLKLEVKVKDTVKKGQPLFTDKRDPSIVYTSPASGVITEINRGARRFVQSIVIEKKGQQEISFASCTSKELAQIDPKKVKDNLLKSGMWTAFRTRPYDKVPDTESSPHSIFVTAIDTHPLAVDPKVVIERYKQEFKDGLQAISRLSDGKVKVFLCKKAQVSLPGEGIKSIVPSEFDGPHPAGLPGTHVHHLDPVSLNKTVWYIGYQDVLAIGKLFTTGKLFTERVISLAGPLVKAPKLIVTEVGADITELLAGELLDSKNARIISGSVLGGRACGEKLTYLGRFHNQITVLSDEKKREFLGWIAPGFKKFSVKNVVMSTLLPPSKYEFNTLSNGDERGFVPIGSYEKVLPLDTCVNFLLRALVCHDTDMAHDLGCMDLSEEDLSLCTFVCNSKIDYGTLLRKVLTTIEKDG